MFIYHTKKFYLFIFFIQVPRENFPRNQLNKNKFWVWRDGSIVRIACCSCRGSEFGSQHSYQAAHSACDSSTKGSDTCTCVCTYPQTDTHAYAQLEIKQLFF